MDIVKMVSASAQSVPPTTPTLLTLSSTPLISKGGDSMAPSTNSIWVKLAGYYLVTAELNVLGTGSHKVILLRGSQPGPSTETLEVSGMAAWPVGTSRPLIIKVSANTFLSLQAVNGGGANCDFTVSLCVARLAGA